MARKMSIGCTDSCQCSRYSVTFVAGCVLRRAANREQHAVHGSGASQEQHEHEPRIRRERQLGQRLHAVQRDERERGEHGDGGPDHERERGETQHRRAVAAGGPQRFSQPNHQQENRDHGDEPRHDGRARHRHEPGHAGEPSEAEQCEDHDAVRRGREPRARVVAQRVRQEDQDSAIKLCSKRGNQPSGSTNVGFLRPSSMLASSTDW